MLSAVAVLTMTSANAIATRAESILDCGCIMPPAVSTPFLWRVGDYLSLDLDPETHCGLRTRADETDIYALFIAIASWPRLPIYATGNANR